MKSFFTLAILLFLSILPAGAAVHTVVSSGFTFSPATLNISEGDTVVFEIGGSHDAVQVSQDTWNANGSTPLPGGWSVGFGGGTVTGLVAGTHYYVCRPHAGLGMKGQIVVSPTTDVRPQAGLPPGRFELEQNYPNPFNPSTTIAFSVERMTYTEVAVYDQVGRLVKTLVAHDLPRGQYTATWDGLDADGRSVGSGTYFVRMRSGENGGAYNETRKILLMR